MSKNVCVVGDTSPVHTAPPALAPYRWSLATAGPNKPFDACVITLFGYMGRQPCLDCSKGFFCNGAHFHCPC